MNSDKASGIFQTSLERLGVHYGMLDSSKLNSMAQDKAYSRGIRDVLEFVNVFAVTAQGGEKNTIGKFLAAAQKRFHKFA